MSAPWTGCPDGQLLCFPSLPQYFLQRKKVRDPRHPLLWGLKTKANLQLCRKLIVKTLSLAFVALGLWCKRIAGEIPCESSSLEASLLWVSVRRLSLAEQVSTCPELEWDTCLGPVALVCVPVRGPCASRRTSRPAVWLEWTLTLTPLDFVGPSRDREVP